MKNRRDFDSAWKEAITRFFRPFLEFFFADIAQDVDWSQPITFLESELRKAHPKDKMGRRRADVLASVHRLDGSQSWVLIHIEVQSQWVAHFEERIWVSHSRIRQAHGAPVCCLAILGDTSRIWKPNCFQEELWGCKSQLHFRSVKLLDFDHLLEVPSLDDNPFALLVAAHLAAQRADSNSPTRRIYKFRLLRELVESRCDSETIDGFLEILDCLLALNAGQDKLLWDHLKAKLPEDKMQFITSFERRGRKEGRKEGRQQGRVEGLEQGEQKAKREIAQRLLAKGMPPEQVADLSGLPLAEIITHPKE